MNDERSDDRDLISALLDDELDTGAAANVAARIAADPDWAAEFAAVTSARELVRALGPVPMPEGFPDGFIATLLEAGHADLSRRMLAARRARLAGTAVAAAAIAAAFLLPGGSQTPAVRPAIEESADGHAVNAALADDPVSQLAPAAGAAP